MSLENTYEIIGQTSPSPDQDRFTFDGSAYTLQGSGDGPLLLPRPYGAAAHDSVRGKIVYTNGGWFDELGTWELDLAGNTWADATHAPSQPQWSGGNGIPGSWASMCFETVGNRAVLAIGNPWEATGTFGDFQIHTWDGSLWTQQTLSGSTVNPCFWPSIHWDETRSLIWGFSTLYSAGFWLTRVWHIDPSTWNVAIVTTGGGGYYPGGPEGKIYASATTMVDWKDNKKALLVTRGVLIDPSSYGPPPPNNGMFITETWVVEESAPDTYTWLQLTEAGSSLSLRGYASCVGDEDAVYLVGGMADHPFDPTVRNDTYKGIVDPGAETITWSDLGASPPSGGSWGSLLVQR